MKLKFECGCSVMAGPDGYGGIDATYLKLCNDHQILYNMKNKKK